MLKKISIFLFVLVIVLFALFANFRSFQVYPIADISEYEVGTYHEDMDTNFSEAKFDIVAGRIVFSYRLSSIKAEPFAAFYFRDKDIDSNIVDLERYNSFSIYLESDKAQRIPISLRFRNDSIIKLSKSYPEISVTTVVDYTKPGVYTVRLSDFEIATWWLRYHGIEKEAIDLQKVTQLKYLAIGSCQALGPGESDQIIIDQVRFINDNTIWYVGIPVFFILVFLVIYILDKSKGKKKTIVVEHLEVKDSEEEIKKQVAAIKNFIATRYTDPDLNMYKVQQEFKMNAAEVRSVFKNEIKDSFKGYLKTVRITEVQRLLKIKTDLTIAEIAYQCGFNDIPYFNRQFKAATGYSPKDFQKLNAK